MITAILIIYAFMAGLTAEYTHTRLKLIGKDKHIAITSLFNALIWPYMLWRISR